MRFWLVQLISIGKLKIHGDKHGVNQDISELNLEVHVVFVLIRLHGQFDKINIFMKLFKLINFIFFNFDNGSICYNDSRTKGLCPSRFKITCINNFVAMERFIFTGTPADFLF